MRWETATSHRAPGRISLDTSDTRRRNSGLVLVLSVAVFRLHRHLAQVHTRSILRTALRNGAWVAVLVAGRRDHLRRGRALTTCPAPTRAPHGPPGGDTDKRALRTATSVCRSPSSATEATKDECSGISESTDDISTRPDRDRPPSCPAVPTVVSFLSEWMDGWRCLHCSVWTDGPLCAYAMHRTNKHETFTLVCTRMCTCLHSSTYVRMCGWSRRQRLAPPRMNE
mmetsp:Transcript_13220/g.38168  ORF Transcript_13220/g.38168 Transcript_13220/m.38168 type:complete len:226 (+) Transcript_13220:668-1345(+)